MKSASTLLNLYSSLSLNSSASNATLGLQLMGDQQRYLVENFFDNERTYQTTTVGSQSLTTTGSLALAATTATLTAVWAYPTVTQLVNFSNSNQRSVLFTNGSASLSWVGGLTSTATTAISTVGVQAYSIPANISKITDFTITIGQLRFTPKPIMTRAEWDTINTLPYTSDIPNYFFIYNNNLEIFPIPSSTGNIVTFNYKCRIPDFQTAFLFSDTSGAAFVAGSTAYDYQAGSLSGITAGSTSITGSSTSWNTTGKFPLNTDVSFYNLSLNIPAPSGEGIWYPISRFTSDTALTLASPIQNAPSATTASHAYSIGQLPVLSEDFADMIPFGSLQTYFSAIVPDGGRFKQYETMFNSRLELLKSYAGSKQINVDLGERPTNTNINLYLYAN